MRDWASSGRLKIKRANEHVLDLERRIADFRSRGPYEIVPYYEIYGKDIDGTSFHVHIREELDPMWSTIAADVVHNLHVALDHLWQRALYGDGHSSRDLFPAFPDLEATKSRFKGKEHGTRKAAFEFLKNLNAYEVGNPFWLIRCFDDTDKHDTMRLVAITLPEFEADLTRTFRLPPQTPAIFKSYFTGARVLKEGDQLYYSSARIAKDDVDHYLPFEITFGEGEVFEHETVLPTLKNLAAAVDSLAAAFLAAGLLA